jgi:exopolyphosphatase/guanosine-5'-triphosphate,3'-diphosphate pyrophosphatase
LTGPILAVGTGGNINKLYNLSDHADDSKTIGFKELTQISEFVASHTYEERVHKLRLNTDRADVIVPAASIYLTAMQEAGCQEIFVPDLGLKDGIIQLLYDRYLRKLKVES